MDNTLRLRELRWKINHLIYPKKLNKYEQYKLNYYIDEYKKLDNDNTPFVYIALAKHYLSIGNSKLAEENLKKAESINSNLPSIIYLRFRLNIKLENYENAYNYLKKYEEIIRQKTDFSIYYYLFNIILNKNENIEVDNLEYINTVKITDPNFKEIWLEFRKNVMSGKYIVAKELIQKLNEYCKSHNIFLNFDEINMLIDKTVLCKIDNKKTIDEEINDIKKLLDEDMLDLAEEKLNDIKKFLDYKSKRIQINLLKRYLNEKKDMIELKKENLYDIYEKFKSAGKLNNYYEDYYTAYQYFTAGYYLTKANIFKFYAARSLFYMGETEKAAEMLLEYNEKGYSRLLKSYRLLANCKCLSCKTRRKLRKEYCLSKTLIEPYNYDLRKKSNIDNCEDIFYEENISDDIDIILDKFEELSNIDKLKYIKYLYQNSNQNIANKLLKQYEKEISKDKTANKYLLQLKKNKTLYINQGKNKF